jgi:hypothetical protein
LWSETAVAGTSTVVMVQLSPPFPIGVPPHPASTAQAPAIAASRKFDRPNFNGVSSSNAILLPLSRASGAKENENRPLPSGFREH